MIGGTLATPNLAGIEESATLGMTARAAALAADGVPVIALSAGEPDFDTPAYVAEAAIRAIREGRTRYPPAAGLAALRAAIAEDLRERLGGAGAARQILVSVGAKQALFSSFFTLFGPGDRVVVPAPYWVSYPPLVRLGRAEPVVVETGPETGFKLTPEMLAPALAAGARGVVLNSPSNPTGAVYTAAELDALTGAAAATGAWILADEIYEEIRYGGPFASMVARAADYERVVVVNGFSKAFAMTGWRVGYAVAPEPMVAAMARLQGHVNTNTSTISQHAALAALTHRAERRAAVDAMVAAFARRRARLLEALSDVPGIVPLPPEGAFYLWIDARDWCAAIGGGSVDLCLDLLEHEHLALVPGSAFGSEGYLRLSFAAADETLERAIERLAAAADRLGASP